LIDSAVLIDREPVVYMVQINEHLQATAKPSVHHATGNSKATSIVSHKPVQPVSGIVFEKEFFDEINTASKPETESSLHTPDDTHTGNNDSEYESAPEPESSEQKNASEGPRYTFSTEIPETYDDFYFCVLPRDPKTLYVYWELPDGTRSEEHKFQEHAPTKEQLVLRVKGHTVENNVPHVNNSYDIPIYTSAADSYVHVPTGASQCSVECGIVNERGNYRPYTPPGYTYDQPIESAELHTCETIEYIPSPDVYGMQSAPVSVGTAFMGPVAETYFNTEKNSINDSFVRSVDLPIVKLDTTHYLGSATPV
jgi:hypothetical protein